MNQDRKKMQPLVIAGTIDGNIERAFRKLSSVANAISTGEDVVVIVIGDCFTKNFQQILGFIKRDCTVPVHVYTLGPLNEEQDHFIKENAVEDILCKNITCFNQYGTFRTSNGVVIAYMSGTEGKTETGWHFTRKNVTDLIDQCQRYPKVDILLTYQWPTSIEKSSKVPVDFTSSSHSKLIGELMVAIKPTLHFAASNEISFTSPVMYHKTDDSSLTVSQFIGLTSFSKYKVGKWVSALNFDVRANPATPEVEVPFDYIGGNHVEINSMRYNTASQKRQGKVQSGDKKRKRMLDVGPADCWFCLGNEKVDNSLIIAIGENAYLTLAKGQIVDDHVIVLPIHHMKTTKNERAVETEIKEFLSSLKSYFDRKNQRLVWFERCFRSPHAQIECLPVNKASLESVEDKLKDLAHAKNLEFERISLLDENYRDRADNYFYLQIASKTAYFIPIPEGGNFPINFGREVMCNALDVPDRIRWQDCVDDENAAARKLKTFREGYSSFNFTLDK